MICKLILKNKENATTRGAVHGNKQRNTCRIISSQVWLEARAKDQKQEMRLSNLTTINEFEYF
jgi:hypothetical protein